MDDRKKKNQNKIQKHIWDKNVAASLHRAFSCLDSLLMLFSLPGLSFFLPFSCPIPAYPLRHGQVAPIVTTTLPLATIPVCLSLPDLYENYLLMDQPETMNFFCLGIVLISFVVRMSGF